MQLVGCRLNSCCYLYAINGTTTTTATILIRKMKEENYYYGGRHVMAKTKAYKSFSFSIFLLFFSSPLLLCVFLFIHKKSHVFLNWKENGTASCHLFAGKTGWKPKKRPSQYQLQRQQTTRQTLILSQMFNVSYEIAVKIIIFIIIITIPSPLPV